MEYNKEILNAIIRNNFSSFVEKVFLTLNPSLKFLPSWHIEAICECLENVQNGKIKRLIINMPPRALKSICVSVAWPAWLLGHSPASKIIVASYSYALSVKHSLDTRLVITSDWYKEIFPNTVLSKNCNRKSKFLTSLEGFRMAGSVGGSITGEGGDFLIVDDPHNPIHINSEKIRKKTLEWFDQTFSTRMNNKAQGAIIVVMQRLHPKDLSGYLLDKTSNWYHLKIPLILEKNITYEIFNKKFSIKKGDIIDPNIKDHETIENLKNEVGIYNFVTQYLQEPTFLQGYFKLEYLCFLNTLPEHYEYIVESWDTAIKIGPENDFSVCTIWGVLNGSYYLIDMLREKYEYPELKKAAILYHKKYNPRIVIIEDKAGGQSLIQDLKAHFPQMNIVKYNPKSNKLERFIFALAFFQAGKIIIKDHAPWKNLLLEEMISFPNSQHDDIVDSITQFIKVISEYKKENYKIRTL